MTKRKGHTKINERVKKSPYNSIPQYPQVVQSQIANDCLKVSIDGHSEPQVISKVLLEVSVQEFHNIMVSTPEEVGLKEEIYIYNNIIISDYTLSSIMPPKIRNISAW